MTCCSDAQQPSNQRLPPCPSYAPMICCGSADDLPAPVPPQVVDTEQLLRPPEVDEPPLSARWVEKANPVLTEEQKGVMKARLEQLLLEFVRQAVLGVQCEIVHPTEGAAVDALYTLDRALGIIRFDG